MAEEKSDKNKSSKTNDSGNSGKGSNGNSNKKNGEEGQEVTIYEWIIASLGFILVFGSVAFMTYKAITANDEPPDLIVKTKSIEKLKAGYLVEFEVKNDGEYTAAVAVIKGELKKGDKTEESSTTTVAYIPSYSTRSGGIFFTKNPKDYKLDVRATGYTEP